MPPPSANNKNLLAIIYRSAGLAYGANLNFHIECIELPSEFRASLLASNNPVTFIKVVEDTEIKCLLNILRQICEKCIHGSVALSDGADYEPDVLELAKLAFMLPGPFRIQYPQKSEGHRAELLVENGVETFVEGQAKEELPFRMMEELCKKGMRLRPESHPVGWRNTVRVE